MTPKPKKNSYHHGNLREELVSVGLAILEAEGPAALSMREVARRLGVTQTAPLHHFESKAALLAAIAAQGFRMLFDHRTAALKDKRDPAERLLTVLMAYVEFALAHPALYHLMHGPEIPDKTLYPELNDAATRSYSLLEAAVGDYLVAHGGSAEGGRDATLGLWTVCQGVATVLTNPQNTPRYVLRKDPMGFSQRTFETFIRGISGGA
ncbi:TetR/AcrR family transcriptional regulator [Piscinibacter sp. HJYY11]|uniref:TetR/AcrR family transcriptional regulator n=1 Tax=Piscinibacter sp. HJYY11 TaxID=2801333 RepID=UPI00191EB81D|nr:TetR/AcrR family transcriptional regulator [Piscinibacter sp. HJYY11]MBL0730676.1 TetR/AcrR family transcriptional regulator [Piscinibacter sp. HJYY11]